MKKIMFVILMVICLFLVTSCSEGGLTKEQQEANKIADETDKKPELRTTVPSSLPAPAEVIECLADKECFLSGIPQCEAKKYTACSTIFGCHNVQIIKTQGSECMLNSWQSDTNGKAINYNDTCLIDKRLTAEHFSELNIFFGMSSVCNQINELKKLRTALESFMNVKMELFAGNMGSYQSEYKTASDNDEKIESLTKMADECDRHLKEIREINDKVGKYHSADNIVLEREAYMLVSGIGNIITFREALSEYETDTRKNCDVVYREKSSLEYARTLQGIYD